VKKSVLLVAALNFDSGLRCVEHGYLLCALRLQKMCRDDGLDIT
jgi:hypothetical protein